MYTALRFGLNCHQFVDDTQLYLVLPADPKKAVETKQVPRGSFEMDEG